MRFAAKRCQVSHIPNVLRMSKHVVNVMRHDVLPSLSMPVHTGDKIALCAVLHGAPDTLLQQLLCAKGRAGKNE